MATFDQQGQQVETQTNVAGNYYNNGPAAARWQAGA